MNQLKKEKKGSAMATLSYPLTSKRHLLSRPVAVSIFTPNLKTPHIGQIKKY
jgi:hypothetical protein